MIRIKPSIPAAIGIWVAYLVVWIGGLLILQPKGGDWDDSFSDAANSRYIALALIGGVAFGAIVTTALGWWRDVLRDDRPVTGWLRWMPWIIFGLLVISTDYWAIADIEWDTLKWIIMASVLVGISEELTFRGLEIVNLRKAQLSEFQVWLISTVLFGLIHVPNALLGANLGLSIINAFIAALAGTSFYLLRRASGTILVPMIAHGIWDFTLFTEDNALFATIRTVATIGLFAAFWFTRDRYAFGDSTRSPA